MKKMERLLCKYLACAGPWEEPRRDLGEGPWPDDQPGTFCFIYVAYGKSKINKLHAPLHLELQLEFQLFQYFWPYVTPSPSLAIPGKKNISLGVYMRLLAFGGNVGSIQLSFRKRGLKNDCSAPPWGVRNIFL